MPSLPGHVTSKFSLEELNDDGEYSTVQYKNFIPTTVQCTVQCCCPCQLSLIHRVYCVSKETYNLPKHVTEAALPSRGGVTVQRRRCRPEAALPSRGGVTVQRRRWRPEAALASRGGVAVQEEEEKRESRLLVCAIAVSSPAETSPTLSLVGGCEGALQTAR